VSFVQRYNFGIGVTADALLGASPTMTTFNAAQLAAMPAVTAPNIVKVTLNPPVNGLTIPTNTEIVYVTSHLANSVTATVLRGQEGTAVFAHLQGELWTSAPTALDFATLGSPSSLRRFYVDQTYGNDALYDGLTPGSPKKTIMAAVSAAGSNAVILVGQGTFQETVALTSANKNITIQGIGRGELGTVIQAPSLTADCVSVNAASSRCDVALRDFSTMGFVDGTGTTKNWTGAGIRIWHAFYGTVTNWQHNNQNTAVYANCGGVGIDMLDAEGWAFSALVFTGCKTALLLHDNDGVSQFDGATENVWVDLRLSVCVQEIVSKGNNTGGNLFLHYKSNGNGNNLPAGQYVIDFDDGGGNVLIDFDASENTLNAVGGPSQMRVNSAFNVILGGVNAPQTQWLITGNDNTIRGLHLNREIIVSGTDNRVEADVILTALNIVDNGVRTIIEGPDSLWGTSTASPRIIPSAGTLRRSFDNHGLRRPRTIGQWYAGSFGSSSAVVSGWGADGTTLYCTVTPLFCGGKVTFDNIAYEVMAVTTPPLSQIVGVYLLDPDTLLPVGNPLFGSSAHSSPGAEIATLNIPGGLTIADRWIGLAVCNQGGRGTVRAVQSQAGEYGPYGLSAAGLSVPSGICVRYQLPFGYAAFAPAAQFPAPLYSANDLGAMIHRSA
jgi:hypothetical protein